MAFLNYHLRCQIGRRAAECFSKTVVIDALLGEAEVSEKHMALSIQYDVLRLQIAIDDVKTVEVFYG